MMTGEVLRFDPDRGFGFIRPDQGGPDLFLHISDLERGTDPHAVRPRVRVSFEEDDTGRGPKAVCVSILGAGTPAAPAEEPAAPTVAAWRALWARVSDAAFEAMLAQARANGWVQD